jgi:two-component system sensor histidine kinase VicK
MNKEQIDYRALEEIASLSPDCVIIYSLEQEKMIYANDPALDLINPRGGISGVPIQSLYESVIPEDREHINIVCRRLLGDRPIATDVEFRALVRGEQRIICANVYMLANNQYAFLTIKDITKPRQHETYLVEFGARKNTLLDALAHQISGALSLTNNLLAQAEKYIPDERDNDLRNYLSLVKENNRQCLQIITDLTEKEHGQSPSIYVRTSRVNAVEIVDYIYKQLNQSTPDKHFVFFKSSPFIYVDTDEVKLLQVINNLASNAVKFTPENKEVRFRVVEKDDRVVISVADDGIGIPDDLKGLIFERRPTVRRPGLKGEKSRGLGLAICADLVRLMKGRIWFESEEGRGSTFYVSIPKEV